MRICIFCHDAYMSGANLSLADWLLEDDKNEYYIFIPYASNDFRHLSKRNNIHIVIGNYFTVCKDLDKRSITCRAKKGVKRVYMKLFYTTFIKRQLMKTVSQIKPDAILSNSFAIWIGADVAKTLGIPHIWHVREFMELDHKIMHYRPSKIRKLANYSSAIFISKSIEGYYTKKYAFKNTAVIYDSIRYQEDSYNNRVKRFIDKPVKAVFAGTISNGKGIFDAIRAVEELNNQGFQISLDIFGEGPQEEEIKKLILDHKDEKIHFLGFSKDLVSRRKKYDVAFVCSKMEALGRVTVEAMYYGNLVIGANSGGTAEIIKNGKTGILYKSGDINDLVKVTKFVINKGVANNEMIREAHDWAIDHFSSPIASQLVQFIYISSKK
ncbi:glycosyl transferase [Lactobacillus delbrueckii subsp. bulgaricus]|nr:glycosyl transferase [Lactobacillus delbrueckii subsp. bulgaricus]MBT8922882.1 glycosyl transferase [Lactobacillus delbrueckii subsp. bulgaricus]